MAPFAYGKRIFAFLATGRGEGDNARMEPAPQLEAFFDLCKDIYERKVRERTWPWPVDSTNSEIVIESDSPDNRV